MDRKNRELLGRIEDQMQAITARCATQNRGLNSSERLQWNQLTDEHAALSQQIAAAERPAGPSISAFTDLQEMRDTFRLHPKQQRERHYDARDRAFSNYLRNGMERISPQDRDLVVMGAQPLGIRNAQSGAVGSQGGYLIPQGFSDLLNIALKWYGGIGVCEEFTTATGNPWPWPTVNDTSNVGHIVGQNIQVAETDLTFGQVTFQAYIGSSDLVLVPLALLEDSYFDFDAMLANLLGIRLGRLRNRMCTIGTGTAQPTGIVTAAITAGNIVQFPTGETSGITYNDLVNLESAVDPAYRENPSSYWMFPDAMLKVIKKLVDGNNRPLWQAGLTASFADGAPVTLGAGRHTILGHPYIINQDMATPQASSYSIVFGDFSRFKVRKVGDLQLLRLVERYADYLQQGFLGFERYDSNLVSQGDLPLALGQQAAS